MAAVIIGMDPHRHSVTIEVMDPDEQILRGGRFDTTEEGFSQMLTYLTYLATGPNGSG